VTQQFLPLIPVAVKRGAFFKVRFGSVWEHNWPAMETEELRTVDGAK
jgi:hypothetical protein